MIKIETPTMLQFYIFLRTFLLQYSRHPIYLTVMVRETESAEEKKPAAKKAPAKKTASKAKSAENAAPASEEASK